MNKLTHWLLAFGYCVIAACSTPCPQTPSRADLGSPPPDRGSSALSSPGGTSSFWTPYYSESVELDWSSGQVVLYGAELNPDAQQVETEMPAPYETWEKTFPVSYAPSAARFRTGNELYVAGQKPDGSTIIERWEFPRTAGMYYSERVTLSGQSPFGTPLTTGPLGVAIEGGSYIVPSLRPAPIPSVVTVYSGTSIGWIHALAVDPDNRFLIATENTGGGRIVQLRLTTPQSLHVVATEAEYPGLLHSGGLTPIDQSQSGRMYMASIGDGIMWISDPANDGILDGTSFLGFREFHAAYPRVTWSMVYP